MPMPPAAYLLGKLLMAVIVAAMVGALLLAMALLVAGVALTPGRAAVLLLTDALGVVPFCALGLLVGTFIRGQAAPRSEEHTSELQSLMRISYAVFCLKK